MKYEITKEVVEAVKQELIRVNVPVQTLISIEQALVKTPIAQNTKAEVQEMTEEEVRMWDERKKELEVTKE